MLVAKHGAVFFRNHYATPLGIHSIIRVAIMFKKEKVMASKPVYQMSARQIILLAFAAAIIAVGATALFYSLTNFLREKDQSMLSLAEEAPQGISDPNAVTDEQNSIEVYKSISPGVAFVNTTSYRQDFWGETQEGKGNGSGSVIDSNGHILTNYHVIEGAQKLSVSFGGEKIYPATLVGGDPDTDLAVIKIERRRPPGEKLGGTAHAGPER